MLSNFNFLKDKWGKLAAIAETAEKYLYSDPNTSMIKAGLVAEGIARIIVDYEAIHTESDDTFATIVSKLKGTGVLPADISDDFYHVRKARNLAAHEGLDSLQRARISLECTFNIAAWFMEVYEDWNFVPPKYIEPAEEKDIGMILKSHEEKIKELNDQINELKKLQVKKIQVESPVSEMHEIYSANLKIENAPLSVRAKNALHKAGVLYTGDMKHLTEADLLGIRNIGVKTKNEILDFILYIAEDSRKPSPKNDGSAEENPEKLMVMYFKAHDVPVEKLYLSNRGRNSLQKNGIQYLSQLAEMSFEEIRDLSGTGQKTANEIADKVRAYTEPVLEKISKGEITKDNYGSRTEEESEKMVMNVFISHSGRGLSAKDIMADCSEAFSIAELMKTIGRLMVNNKIIFDQNGDYALYCPSFIEVVNHLADEKEKDILLKRVSGRAADGRIGMTLDEVGTVYNLTRERIRQIEGRARQHVKEILDRQYNVQVVSEDSFKNLFTKYFFDIEAWVNKLELPAEIYNYLNMYYSKGIKDISEAPEDFELTSFERKTIRNYILSEYIDDNGTLVLKKTTAIEKYLIASKCKEITEFKTYEDYFKEFLENHGLSDDPKLSWTKKNARARENAVERSNITLWMQGHKFRYYDIQSNDYDDLYDALSLNSYENTEISAKKLLSLYPEVMKQYDIRNEFELHNLLRKTGAEDKYPSLKLSRAPTLQFGKTDRDYLVFSMMINQAPVTPKDLSEAIEEEYGFLASTVMRSWLNPIRDYLQNGVYRVDFEDMPAEHINKLNELLQEPFYYIEDIRKIYQANIENADVSLVTSYNLRKLGFVVNRSYVVRGYNSARDYFQHLLLEPDEVDITEYKKRFSGLTEFSATLDKVRDTYEILEVNTNHFVNYRVFENQGLTKEIFRKFCDEVAEFAGEEYFTMHSLRSDGFASSGKCVEQGDKFCESLLREDNRFQYQRTGGFSIFRRSEQPISRRSLIIDMIREEEIIEINDLIKQLFSVYGLSIERWDVIEAIGSTNIHYDIGEGILSV